MVNCTNYYGSESNFSKPMPYIGLYIALASLVCPLAMIADIAYAILSCQVWHASRYFSLNAASLTIIGAATKLSVDLTTSMPGLYDQLAKLSSSVLICVSMAIFIPSLGKMGNTELVTNLIALVILILTIIINLFIQLKTGVIYLSMPGQILFLGSMVYLLMVCCSTAIALASIKDELRVQYEKKHRLAVNEFTNTSGERMTKRLEEYLMKFSVMSHTGWPYMVLRRSLLGSTTAFICTVDVLCLSVIFALIYVQDCDDESDYKWSTFMVFWCQSFAASMGLGTLYRESAFYPTPPNKNILSEITNVVKLEGFWTRWLVEIKQRPFFLFIHKKVFRKFIYHTKYHFCNLLIANQVAMVLMIKVLGSSYNFFVKPLLRAYDRFCFRIQPKFIRNHLLSITPLRANLTELRPYILYLEGEEELNEMLMKIALYATSKYIKAGKDEEPSHLIEFLQTSLSHGFNGVLKFDSEQVCCLNSDEPPTHCWSLPVVTMTSIAISLSNIDACLVNKLLRAVRQGLVYVKIIEENFNNSTDSINMRKAADIVWEQVDSHGRWLDVKLNELATPGNHPTNILNLLVDSAKDNFEAFLLKKEKTSIWPIEAVASISLYRICQTILLDCQNGNSRFQTTNDMFEMLSSAICDILGACLTNLQHSILMKCSQSTIENMNETAWHVLNLFGSTEKIMKLLDEREKPNLSSDQLAFIDEWRRSYNTANQLP